MSFSVSVDMATITCCHKGCGIVFAVPSWWRVKREEDHSSWVCPNGHSQYFYAESEAEILRKKLNQQIAAHDQTRAELRDSQAEKERIAKRVANGVCPCCNRHFTNLQRHMATKHPETLPKKQPKPREPIAQGDGYKCPDCAQEFRHYGHARRHVSVKHPTRSD